MLLFMNLLYSYWAVGVVEFEVLHARIYRPGPMSSSRLAWLASPEISCKALKLSHYLHGRGSAYGYGCWGFPLSAGVWERLLNLKPQNYVLVNFVSLAYLQKLVMKP